MMNWYQIISFICTNGIRIFLCLCLIDYLMDARKTTYHKIVLFSGIGAVLATALLLLQLPHFYLIGAELMILFIMAYVLFHKDLRICLFLIFFYEIGVAQWEFLAAAGLSILARSDNYIISNAVGDMISVWIVRFLMIGIAVFIKRSNRENRILFKAASISAVIGLFGAVILSEQSVIALDYDLLAVWIILSVIYMFAVLMFNLRRQYDMEREILRLKEEQTEIFERDYQALNKTYRANAKLFHDFHNHIEVMYGYLLKEKTEEAFRYLGDLRSPTREIVDTVWTGDEALDYLINLKRSLAEEENIALKINIEFPRNTNIHSANLTAILGNLFDNALEAARDNEEGLRYIHVKMRRINSILVIKVENGCKAAPVMSGREIQSSKGDEGLHGWGLKSVRTAAERYDGAVEILYEENRFCVVVTLCFDALKIK